MILTGDSLGMDKNDSFHCSSISAESELFMFSYSSCCLISFFKSSFRLAYSSCSSNASWSLISKSTESSLSTESFDSTSEEVISISRWARLSNDLSVYSDSQPDNSESCYFFFLFSDGF